MGKFEFVQLAALRAAQLMRGCTPRVALGYKATTTALREVAELKVCRMTSDGEVDPDTTL
jgi:DNA-directed RNA polymerase subunit K/omega